MFGRTYVLKNASAYCAFDSSARCVEHENSNGYYVEEVAAVLSIPRSNAEKLSHGMDDGDIDLGTCIQRHEEDKRRKLIYDEQEAEE